MYTLGLYVSFSGDDLFAKVGCLFPSTDVPAFFYFPSLLSLPLSNLAVMLILGLGLKAKICGLGLVVVRP